MIDTNQLHQAALQSAEAEIAEASARRRKFDEGETSDKALWSDIRAAALAGMSNVFAFDIADVGAYFRQFPDLASRPAPRGPIGAGIRALILELVLEQDEDLHKLHASQFEKYERISVQVWSEPAIRLIQRHGDPISKNMRDNIAAIDDDATAADLDGARETLDYIATRIEAHKEYQRKADRADYETLSRRVREAIDFVEIEIGLEAERHRAPRSVSSPVPRR